MNQHELMKKIETSVVYFDAEQLEEHKEMLWALFLAGKIESRMVRRHGILCAEIVKPWRPGTAA